MDEVDELRERLEKLEKSVQPRKDKPTTMQVNYDYLDALNNFRDMFGLTKSATYEEIGWRIIYENQELFLENESLKKRVKELEEKIEWDEMQNEFMINEYDTGDE